MSDDRPEGDERAVIDLNARRPKSAAGGGSPGGPQDDDGGQHGVQTDPRERSRSGQSSRPRPPSSPSEPADDDGDDNEDEDERDRGASNIVIALVAAALIGLGVWLVDALLEQRRIDDCAAQGQRNCAPIAAPGRNH